MGLLSTVMHLLAVLGMVSGILLLLFFFHNKIPGYVYIGLKDPGEIPVTSVCACFC